MIKLSISAINSTPRAKSKAALVAEFLPDIEAFLDAGHSHKVIFEHIKNRVGIELTFGYYENTIHRIRQRQKSAEKQKVSNASIERVQQPAQTNTLSATNLSTTSGSTSKVQDVLLGQIGNFFS